VSGAIWNFVVESNRIEGILRKPTEAETNVHEWFLQLDRVRTRDVERFVETVAGASLRDREGRNVRVGAHYPPPGHREMGLWLGDLLEAAYVGAQTSWETHNRYEKLHPFMDGNGRSGRAIWAWQMQREGHDPFLLPFLHRFYYQTLDAHKGTPVPGMEKP
jgi:hypothetical protein